MSIAVALVGLSPSDASAWTSKTHLLIAETAASVSPPDLRRQIDRHLASYREGCRLPMGAAHGRLDQHIEEETARTIAAIRNHRPFRDVVRQMGVVSYYVATANNPLNTDNGDPMESSYSTDFARYVESAQGRFRLAFYGEGREIADSGVAPLLQRTLRRGRDFYRSIGREYRRVGGPPGRTKFDDKSVAFAVGSLAVSHAVSDVGAVLRHIWIEAGGADKRPLPVTPGGAPSR